MFLLCSTVLAQDVPKIEILTKGYGPKLQEGQKATISFVLETADGKTIENKSEREPFKFVAGDGSVLPGLLSGVLGMQLQEIRKITVPPSLGYGAQETGPIPPNSTLIFTVTLLLLEEPEALPDEADLSERFQDEEFLNKRNARDIEKPAMFEYIIRDFFTKPWRYSDGYKKTLGDCGLLLGVLLLMLAVFRVGSKKGYWTT